MDFKILELKFKNEIIELINSNSYKISDMFYLLKAKGIEQLLEIEQNTNNDSLEPFPKNFDFIKINLRHISCGMFVICDIMKYILNPLIPDVSKPKLDFPFNIFYVNKNIGHIYTIIEDHIIDYYGASIKCDNDTYEHVKLEKICDFFVSKLPCFAHIGNCALIELQKNYNVMPIEQFDGLYYLKPKGLLTKAAIK
ncbi:hypothetical protein Hokovirus_2_12 [Hokovirus HKV1]|uniref:Uncharacterized protein n=1 Tax=Hokovirus HKV1 TaxID=1977638 RepID=A0A1V0SFJ1_9VIRU|nr:hypothetical protein Hokovirus_2_12 [Hokovirus HKV1]